MSVAKMEKMEKRDIKLLKGTEQMGSNDNVCKLHRDEEATS